MVVASLLLIVCAVVLLVVGLGGGSNAFLAGSILASLLAAIALILVGRRSADRLSDVPERFAEDERARAASDPSDRMSVVDLLEADTERVNVPAARRRLRRPKRVTVGAGAGSDADGDPDGAADPGTGTSTERSVIPAQQTVTGRGPSTDDEPAVPDDEPALVGEPAVAEERNPADGSANADEGEPADEPPAQASSPADAAVIATMAAPVYVIDGRPRYHLRSCAHLLGRQSEALPVYEAVELEFTPCGLCEPDTRILAEARR